ncbi:hypothetical protein E1202_12380 [Saccharopolyspora karakumensis]|uniref:Tellurium resistance protein TerC n=1 Tax=Saccharopolyspora karakumensis TaxID=2530386 RepID=A0A4R5BXD7_9PSEU|nr:hypothetical protein [Saccharopolyspora karakumensis]TDD88992.1 hypothetical protein E1202_12380 [Saccharopolyspora karakumensis]
MSVPALLPFAAVAVLLAAVATDLLACARGRAPTRHDLLVAGAGIAAALLVATGLSIGAPPLAGEFLAAWGSAFAVTVDLVVVLVVLTHQVPDARRLVVLAIGASALTRIVLAATGVAGVGWTSALFGLLVLVAAWWLFRSGETGLPHAGALSLGAVPAAVALGAFAVSATGGGPVVVLCANLIALLGAVRLVRLTARLCARASDASVGFSALLVFLGVKSLVSGLSGHGPAHDAGVTVLSLGMALLVAALMVITAVRAER